MTTTLWWVSWYQHGDDCRPAAWPPPEPVLAFWESGVVSDYEMITIVAIVRAGAGAVAKEIIEGAWSPGVAQFRFADQINGPPGDRFPPPDWSIELGRWPWSIKVSGE